MVTVNEKILQIREEAVKQGLSEPLEAHFEGIPTLAWTSKDVIAVISADETKLFLTVRSGCRESNESFTPEAVVDLVDKIRSYL